MNRHRLASLSILILLAAALACERDANDSETTSGATLKANESSSTGATTSTDTTGTALPETTDTTQATTSTTSEPGDSSTTGSQPVSVCASRLTKDACNIDNDPQGSGYSFCLWVNISTWTANTPCPDLAAGKGQCIQQDFTDDCSKNPSCTFTRPFVRRVGEDTYELFAHPDGCGTPIDYGLCGHDDTDLVCPCFGCP